MNAVLTLEVLSQCNSPGVLLITQVADVLLAGVEVHRGNVVSHGMVAVVDLRTVRTLVVGLVSPAAAHAPREVVLVGNRRWAATAGAIRGDA